MVAVGVKRLERWALLATLLAIMFPLTLQRGPIGLAAFDIPLGAVLLFWLGRSALRAPGFRWDTFDVLLILLGAWMAGATILNAPKNLSELMMFESALLLGIYANHNYRRTYDWAFVYRFALVALLLQVSVAILQIITFSSIGNVRSYFGETQATEPVLVLEVLNRPVGTVGFPNLLGNWLVMLMPFIYVRFAPRYRNSDWAAAAPYFALWMLCVGVMIASLTRMNLVALFISLVLFWCIQVWQRGFRPSRNALHWIGKATLALALLVFLVAVFNEELRFFLQIVNERVAETGSSYSLRMEQYRGALISTFRHPLFGVGFGASPDIWASVKVNMPSWWSYSPHNVYLMVSTEAGLPALALFLAVVGLPVVLYIHSIDRAPTQTTVLFVSVAVFLSVANTYVHPIDHALWPLFMFLLGTLHRTVRQPYLRPAQAGP